MSLTCNAWQASNANAYFAVTGHWIDELPNGDWEMQTALFGFTQMNTSHDGVKLGRALFKIVERLNIQHKVSFDCFLLYLLCIGLQIGWITCDNAANNTTMLEEFGRRMNCTPSRASLKPWDHLTFHIR